jgi:glycosyltransferase involved in cell wall biosynthesis
MTPGRTVTLVIPILNGEKYIENQWRSFQESGILGSLSEVIYVNDGSTDRTHDLLSKIQVASPVEFKILNHPVTKGRFLARLSGARSAISTHVLFLDSRLTIDTNFASAFSILRREADCLMGHVDIDINRSVFCLYWDRTHRVIFKSHFERTKNRVMMTSQNVAEFLKGTTVFYSLRDVFIEVCSRYENAPLLNDDTVIIEEIASITPLMLDPSWRISWVPRENMLGFLGRMWERGPSFVEYHVFAKQDAFFKVVMAGLAFLLAWIAAAIFMPLTAALIGAAAAAILLMTTAFFSKSIKEFFLMAPLHFATILIFGAGIIWGLGVNFKKRIFTNSNRLI